MKDLASGDVLVLVGEVTVEADNGERFQIDLTRDARIAVMVCGGLPRAMTPANRLDRVRTAVRRWLLGNPTTAAGGTGLRG